ncbi:hypothetical protein KGO95_01930 [Patescibacteria group bacterium]|nr:hypothetical protein [Patescibacteria group bacterium]
MSLLSWMVESNIPLHTWRSVLEDKGPDLRYSGWNTKKLGTTARIIINGCANDEVVDLVVQEWDSLPQLLRMALTNEANVALQENRSGNKIKGIKRLNDRLGGRVLRSEMSGQTERKLRVIGGKLVSEDRRINPAVAGASQAHAAYGLPPNYDSLPPAEKRRLREKLARERREGRS